jgi:hypothetical protein
MNKHFDSNKQNKSYCQDDNIFFIIKYIFNIFFGMLESI